MASSAIASKTFKELVGIYLFALATLLILIQSDFTNRFDHLLLDEMALFNPGTPPDDVLIVAIDDTSIKAIGPWPWSRDVQARLIDRISEANPAVIVEDFLFLDETSPNDDASFARSIAKSGKVVLPLTFEPSYPGDRELVPVRPLDQFASRAIGMGHITVARDHDGITRRFELYKGHGDNAYPHLSVAAIQAQGRSVPARPWGADASNSEVYVPLQKVYSFPFISAVEILDGNVPTGVIENRVIFIGGTAHGLGDYLPVAKSLGGEMSGIEVLANVYHSIDRGKATFKSEAIWSFLYLAAFITLYLTLIVRVAPGRMIVLTVGLCLLLVATSFVIALQAQLWLPPSAGILIILSCYPIWSWRRLSIISDFLDREARLLEQNSPTAVNVRGGMDYIAMRLERLQGLVRTVGSQLAFRRDVIEASPNPIIVLDSREEILLMNSGAGELFPAWGIGDRISVEKLRSHNTYKNGADNEDIAAPDGRIFGIAGAPLRDGDGEPTGSILVFHDVTSDRRAERERRETLEFLSHDMRSPQVAIIGAANAALARAGDPDSVDTIKAIQKEARRTLMLADNFVQFARLENMATEFVDADLVSLAEEAVDRCYHRLRERNLAVHQTAPEDPVFLSLEPSLIGRMFDNLLDNAIKFSPDGSQIDIAINICGKDAVELIVADHGPGFSHERQKDPFMRFGVRDTTRGPSAGLGLAFVKRVVDIHGGAIEVVSKEGHGATIRIRVPRESVAQS